MPEFNRIERMFQSHRVVVFVVVVRIMVARLCVFLCWQGRSGEALVWESSTSMRAEVVIKKPLYRRQEEKTSGGAFLQ